MIGVIAELRFLSKGSPLLPQHIRYQNGGLHG